MRAWLFLGRQEFRRDVEWQVIGKSRDNTNEAQPVRRVYSNATGKGLG